MLQTHEATLHPDGMLSFRNQISLKGTRQVLVTILDEAETPAAPPTGDDLPLGDVRRTLQLLSSREFQLRAYGSAARMHMAIRENRSAWDESRH